MFVQAREYGRHRIEPRIVIGASCAQPRQDTLEPGRLGYEIAADV